MFRRKKEKKKTEGLITINEGLSLLFKKSEKNTFYPIDDDDILLYAIEHSLSLNQYDYATDELDQLKTIALEGKNKRKERTKEKIYRCLNGFKDL